MKPLRFYYTLGVKRGHPPGCPSKFCFLAALSITTRTKKRPWFIARGVVVSLAQTHGMNSPTASSQARDTASESLGAGDGTRTRTDD